MLACFRSPGRSRVAFQVLVPGSLGVVESGLFFVTECTIEKRVEQIAVELDRLVETRQTSIKFILFKPGHAQIIIDLSRVSAAAERLFEFSDSLVELPLR